MKKIYSFTIVVLILACLILSFCACDDAPPSYDGYRVYDVMSMNIRMDAIIDFNEKNWADGRGALVCDYIRNSGADVVCLQEVCLNQHEDILSALGDVYSVIYYQREAEGRNPEGLAILYSNEFELVESNRFWLSSTPDTESKDWGAAYKRISVNAVLRDKTTSREINVFTVHLDHISELSRENGLSLILERAAQYDCPAILAGDFNTNENSDCYSIVAEQMQDCRKVAPVTDSGLTYQNFGSIKQTEESLPIDFCFADNSFSVFEFDIKAETTDYGVYYSDHYAITAKLGLPLPETAEESA